jgi:putative protease
MIRSDIELMAPVGSFESLIAAIQGNADSVYFGVGRLNMRSKSSINFTLNDLKQIIDICNQNYKKPYLTLNSILYNEDLIEMKEIIDEAKQAGISAIIASDESVLNYSRKKNIELHLSTQLNISNIETVKFYSPYADVMVLARELSLEQIKAIISDINNQNIIGPSGKPIQIEIFAHGALCMAISGKCYLSLHEYNHSANRGECYQLCRRSYILTDKETNSQIEIDNEYIISPKDLCTINFLDKIIDANIKVLKIEGRARSPEYVKTVCSCYDQAINAYCEKKFTNENINKWMLKLSEVYNRGFWDGYYLGKKIGEWSNTYGSKATKKKEYIGKCLNYFTNIKVAEFIVETGSLKIHDEILIIGPTSGVIEFKVAEIKTDKISVNEVKKGERFSIPLNVFIRRSDKLFKITDVN